MSEAKISVGDTVLVSARVVEINEAHGAKYVVNFAGSIATTSDVYAHVYEKAIWGVQQSAGVEGKVE
jgi:hypothetical protein